MPDFTAYGAALNGLLQAQERVAQTPADEQALAAMQVATDRLREAEEPIAAELDQAWGNNITGLAAANQAFAEARQALTVLEGQVSEAARGRSPDYPIVNEEELAQLEAANATVEAARAEVADAKTTFKAGVTVEQLEAI